MNKRARLRSILAAVATTVGGVGLPATAPAYTIYTWSGTGAGNWSDSANWVGGTVPAPGTDAVLRFNATGTNAVAANNDLPASPFQVYVMQLSATATVPQTITGGPLEFVTTDPINLPTGISSTPVQNSSAYTIQNDLVIHQPLGLAGSLMLNPVTLTGTTSGPGEIKQYSGRYIFAGTANHLGGLEMIGGRMSVVGSSTLGSGPVSVSGYSSRLFFDSPANARDNSVTLSAGGTVVFNSFSNAALAKFTPASGGILGITASYAGALDLTNHPNLRVGTYANTSSSEDPATVTLSGAITPAGSAYRFGGHDGNGTGAQSTDVLVISSPLTNGPGNSPRSVVIDNGISTAGAGHVRLTNTSNSYSGGTVVGHPNIVGGPLSTALTLDFTPTAGQTPFGTGPIDVYGTFMIGGQSGSLGSLPNAIHFHPGSALLLNDFVGNTSYHIYDTVNRWPDAKPVALDSTDVVLQTTAVMSPRTESIGAVSFDGRSRLYVSNTGSSLVATLAAQSLTRTGRGTLTFLANGRNAYGGNEVGTGQYQRFQLGSDAGVVDPVTGDMLMPYIVGDDNSDYTADLGWFLKRDAATGNVVYYDTMTTGFNPAADNEVASIAADYAINSETAASLRSYPACEVTINPGQTLTLRAGGVILGGKYNSGSLYTDGGILGGTLRFDNNGAPVEGVFFVNKQDAAVTSVIDGAGGITKFGARALLLYGSNTFTGGLQINEGTVKLANPGALNASNPNAVTIGFYGTLDLNGNSVTVPSLTGAGMITNSATATPATLTVDSASDLTYVGTIGNFSTLPPGIPLALTKAGGGTLTLTGGGNYNGLTTVSGGSLVVAGTRIQKGNYSTAAGTSLVFQADNAVGDIDGNGRTVVAAGVKVTANHISQGSLTSSGAITLRPAAEGGSASALGALVLNAGGTLDLADNELHTSGAGPTTGVSGNGLRAYLRDRQLFSSVADADPLQELALGYTDDAAPYVVKLTYFGDANLDGAITADDYALIDRAFAKSLAGAHWTDGDFNYDGLVDQQDYLLMDRVFALESGTLSAGLLADREARFGADYVARLVTSVPEPSLLSGVIGGVLASVGLRRRRRGE